MPRATVLTFDSRQASLENAGGKGMNLVRLAQAGFPVPRGFIVPTDAYRAFVSANHLQAEIDSALSGLSGENTAELEAASARIREAFAAGVIPVDLAASITAAYLDFRNAPVAVRSSATAEDLPDVSFAGQQDTFLNIAGPEHVLKAVTSCWSSLWTARAIGYRLRNQVDPHSLALAVVVQEMVQSDASGVLFTAEPLSGLRSQTVIEAVLGLGEALVSGQVEPDRYVVDTLQARIVSRSLGAKQTSTRSKAGGGVQTVQEQAAGRPALTDEQVLELVAMGQKVEQEYQFPQDIEWAYAGGKLFLLQARPITSLFPIPRLSRDPLIVWFSFGAFQGVVGPLTPLGRECIQRIIPGIAKRLEMDLKFEEQRVLEAAGERIWINITDLIRNLTGRRILGGFLRLGEPGSAQILGRLMAELDLGPSKGGIRPGMLLRIVRFARPGLAEIPRALLQPEKMRARFDAQLDAYLETVQVPGGGDRFERLANVAAFLDKQGGLADALPVLLPRFMPIMAPSLALLNLIGHLLPPQQEGEGGGSTPSMELTRGLPRTITMDMDLRLWQVSTLIKQDAEALQAFENTNAPVLAARYLSGDLPPAAQVALQGFLDRYGMRCAGEIDLGQPRWREDPTPILLNLQSYLKIAEENSPPVRHAINAQAAHEAMERMATRARRGPAGWLREKLLRAAARRVRLLLGARESPKFYAVRAMDLVRRRLLEIGEEFAEAGTIPRREDLFYLQVSELEEMARSERGDWQALIAARRAAYERELRRRQLPRILLSDGRAFYEGLDAGSEDAEAIFGSPVSPGVVEGRVRVIFDPLHAELAPGEILVCPGTDPAWTPLFLSAGGLVMEVGGMMTHGSVVAREYGIPAVVGVHQATQRLKTGQRVRVDGTQGKVILIDD